MRRHPVSLVSILALSVLGLAGCADREAAPASVGQSEAPSADSKDDETAGDRAAPGEDPAAPADRGKRADKRKREPSATAEATPSPAATGLAGAPAARPDERPFAASPAPPTQTGQSIGTTGSGRHQRPGFAGTPRAPGDGKPQDEGGWAGGTPLLGQPPADMFFQNYGTNPTIDTAEQAFSTFSVDVDSASYAIARSYLSRQELPAEASVRVEEFVNAFDYGYRAPAHEVFSVQAEAAPSPNRSGYHVLHIGLKGKEVAASERAAANLVFVVDVSGSMAADNRLGLVKQSLGLLLGQLDDGDTVSLVTYGTNARIALEPTNASRRGDIQRAIDGLRTEGATNAAAGIRLGYQLAERQLRPGGINRVVLCSDGVANVGLTGAGGILEMVAAQTKRGITISAVGFGMGNYNDVLMEKLAQGGNGNYYYVDQLGQARKVFVDNLTGTLQVIAKDVKIQMELDRDFVARYRLLGYENRQLEKRDFQDDQVDAGEVGAGHAVTAIYEVKLKPGALESNARLGTLRLRYKAPEGGASELFEKALPSSIVKGSLDELSSPARLSLAAAGFAEKLRGSYWARNLGYEDLLARFEGMAPGLRERADVVELRSLIERASGLDSRQDRFEKLAPVARMDFDRVPILQ